MVNARDKIGKKSVDHHATHVTALQCCFAMLEQHHLQEEGACWACAE